MTDQMGQGGEDRWEVVGFSLSEAAKENSVEAAMIRQRSQAWDEPSWEGGILRQ